MKIIALIGRSGTGKSHKAVKLANEQGIKYIIDDGVLIKLSNDRCEAIAGKSSKECLMQPKKSFSIVTFDGEHREKVIEKINELNPNGILILGIRKEIIDKITNNLGLPKVTEITRIEDYSTEEEIYIALKLRKNKMHKIIYQHEQTCYALSVFESFAQRENIRSFQYDNYGVIIEL